jgi:micrococcal nuclease
MRTSDRTRRSSNKKTAIAVDKRRETHILAALGLILAALCMLMIVPGMARSAETVRVKVVRIVDGDTIQVSMNGKKEKVRFIGIDTLESRKNKRAYRQARSWGVPVEEIVRMGREAKKITSKMIPPGTVVDLEFDVDQRDRYGRLLAYVWVGPRTMLNAELVRIGYAQQATFPPNVKYVDLFRKLARQAREQNRGHWQNAR